MKHPSLKWLMSVAVLLPIVALVGPSPVNGVLDDGGPSQADLDNVSGTSSVTSRWDQSTAGVSKRPYIKRLSITNGSTETVVIANETSPGVPTLASASPAYNVTGTIAGYNICASGQTTNCYPNPNRVAFTLVYVDASNSNSNRRNFDGVSTNPVVNADSIVDVTIALNELGSTLGWTWMNGTPLYWETSGLGTNAGTVRVKYKPAKMPQPNSCTAIPVSTCDVDSVAGEHLMTELILSLDTTLPSAFKGALFASEGAFIGSLDVIPGGNGTAPQLTYGIAAPKYMSNGTTERRGKFYAVLSNTILKDQFSVNADATDSSMASLMNIARKSDTTKRGSDTIAWTKWTASTNGIAGRLVTISDISFSAPKFLVTATTTSTSTTTSTTSAPTSTTVAPTTTTTPSVRVGRTISRSTIASTAKISIPAGAKVTLSIGTTSKKYCSLSGTSVRGISKGSCSVTISVTPKATKSVPKPKTTKKTVRIAVA